LYQCCFRSSSKIYSKQQAISIVDIEVPDIDGRKGEEAKGGNLEGGLPAAGRDGGVEGLEDGAGPESGGLLLRDRGLAGDPRNSGLGAEDAGDGIRLLSIGGGRGGWVSSPPADTALGCRDGRRAGNPGRRGRRRGRRWQMHGARGRDGDKVRSGNMWITKRTISHTF
jgi:hypothetical protein